MTIAENCGRWPPIYDFDELGLQINRLIDDGSIFDQFFQLKTDTSEFFQGDIISLKQNPFFIDKDGDITTIAEDFDYWLIIGNTCDLARASDQNATFPHLTHITPLIPIPSDIPSDILINFKKYKFFKKIFIPKWDSYVNDFYIDLTILNSIEKKCLTDKSTVIARLNYKTWLLLHSCLVRYLARDDGRHD